ncbi:MAG: inositol monophosphatase family protein [bacterium]
MKAVLRLARLAAREAGRIVLGKHAELSVMHKGNASHNLVTTADLEAEEAILERVRRRFPGHAFLTEEQHPEFTREAPDLWIVDPLDGTNNYAHRFPHFCVSIAYARHGEVLAGAVFDPVRKEMFTALHGGGAFLNGKKIETSSCADLAHALVTTGFYYDRGEVMERTLGGIRALFHAGVQGIRRTGSAALDLCWLACGRMDAYFEYELSVWDYAAGMLIVREAGGTCADRAGRPLDLHARSVIASNGRLQDELLAVVRWAPGC